MTTFYTADLHLFHENILRYCNRPFKTPERMWTRIKKNWNNTVSKDDEVWIAGDLTLKKEGHKGILSKMIGELNGTKHLVIGNHDLMRPIDYQDIGITSIHYPAVRLPGGWMVAHDPTIANVMSVGEVLICGHQHGCYFKSTITKNKVFVIDVGVDIRNFTPISHDAIRQIISNGETE